MDEDGYVVDGVFVETKYIKIFEDIIFEELKKSSVRQFIEKVEGYYISTNNNILSIIKGFKVRTYGNIMNSIIDRMKYEYKDTIYSVSFEIIPISSFKSLNEYIICLTIDDKKIDK